MVSAKEEDHISAYKLYFSVYETVNNCLVSQNERRSSGGLEGTA